ncbi:FGGY-family carbohydrate kinase [Clostridium sp.]|uniref:FGGY-family carbohydrate kinase n=1 Tax=Clostridium sp. TaxID=1506 RepID=UPI003216CB23
MDEGYVLSIDCGTQSIRALIFDKEGNLIGKEKEEFEPYFSTSPGWAEQDPEIWWNGLCKVCKTLKSRNLDNWEKIKGVTVTTQRDTGINIDKNGKVLRPAIIWLDQRMAKCEKLISKKYRLMFTAVGMNKAIEISRRKVKSNWIKENEPDIWENTYKYLLLSGFLNYRLTGKLVDSIASQIAHIPFDYKNKCWPKNNNDYRWEVFGVEREKLPELIEPGKIIGGVTKSASEYTGIMEDLPVIASGSDKGCETIGTGCINLESANLSFGTTATVQTTSNFYFEPIKFMPAYPACIEGCYNPELEIFRGYWMISWFKREFGMRESIKAEEMGVSPEVLLNEILDEVPPGSQGLMLQPYWGPGLKMPKAKGAIIGFGDVHTRAHIYRAIIEGINYALIDGVKKIEKCSKVKVKKIMVSGGGSQSDVICQITSDMFNRPVYKSITYETSGLGAAIIGFIGLGVYKTYEEAIEKMVHYSQVFYPRKDNAKIYDDLFNKVYKKIYSRLGRLYSQIQGITNYPDI